ncbi:MAG: argininosuccinate lyase [Gammaproteobacteria bacterium]|nr:argininosuccinate lyase [Gammaproteobacteria bacterium]|tara:strand:- start:4869 stop:6278 length:1410 start_codon:yes stop_codon:yes gene_type:complete
MTNKKKNTVVNPSWGGRFENAVNRLAVSYTSSIDVDKRLYEQDILGSLKYALALKEAKVIKNIDYLKISKGLKAILKEIESGRFQWKEELEDVHMNIEDALKRKAGNAAKKLHTGRSRNDQVSTDLRLFVLKSIDEIGGLISSVQTTILGKAKKHYADLMPGFTHLQVAQPVTFGHHLMAWYEMLNRDFARLEDTKKRTSIMPLGSGALSGNRYNIDRQKLAKRLNFNGISNNSIDAVSDRDFSIELLSNLSILGIHLSRINEELILWSSSQFNYVELPDEFCTGSSIMPQKKNPDVSELMRGGSSRTISNLMGLLTLMKGLPLAYNRDMQEDKNFVFDSLDYSKSSLELLSLMIKRMIVNTKKMKEDCQLGQLTATELADYLVLKGLPFRKAHEVVGKIVAFANKNHIQIFEVDLTKLRKFSKLISEDVFTFIKPEEAIKNKNSIGGSAPREVLKQIKKAEKQTASRK